MTMLVTCQSYLGSSENYKHSWWTKDEVNRWRHGVVVPGNAGVGGGGLDVERHSAGINS